MPHLLRRKIIPFYIALTALLTLPFLVLGIPAHPEAAHTRAWTVGFWASLAFLAAYLLGLCAYVLDWMLGAGRSAWIDAYIRVTCIGFAVAMLIATVILPWSR